MPSRSYMGVPRELIPWAPRIDHERCTGCGQCRDFCPNDVYALNDQTHKMEIAKPENCVVLCDKCQPFCPRDAIGFPDKEETKMTLNRLRVESRQRKEQS